MFYKLECFSNDRTNIEQIRIGGDLFLGKADFNRKGISMPYVYGLDDIRRL